MKYIFSFMVLILTHSDIFAQIDSNSNTRRDSINYNLIKLESINNNILSAKCIITFVGCDNKMIEEFNKYFYVEYIKNGDNTRAFNMANEIIKSKFPDSEVMPILECK